MSTPTELLSLSSAGLAGRFLSMLAYVGRTVFGCIRAIGNRRDVHLLLEMDERALKDIGLTRHDVLGALANPLLRDPSKILLVRSVERRARSRSPDLAGAQAQSRPVRV
jgi:hypothetical protein